MVHAAVLFERKYKVSDGPSHHGQAVPVRPKESDCPEDNPVRCEDLKASVPIQVIICLLEVQENLKEDCLPHGHKLLEQLDL